jgi:hypothetical protein
MSAIAEGDYVFSDPIAFKHLAQEEGTSIVEENVIIEGYQVYVVEQWACSRVHPVFVVTTFTGDVSNKVVPHIGGTLMTGDSECPESIKFIRVRSS